MLPKCFYRLTIFVSDQEVGFYCLWFFCGIISHMTMLTRINVMKLKFKWSRWNTIWGKSFIVKYQLTNLWRRWNGYLTPWRLTLWQPMALVCHFLKTDGAARVSLLDADDATGVGVTLWHLDWSFSQNHCVMWTGNKVHLYLKGFKNYILQNSSIEFCLCIIVWTTALGNITVL